MMQRKVEINFASGQAMIETLVSFLALIPLVFGIYYIAKYMDIRDTTIEASRFAAWETTVGATDVGTSVQEKFFRHELAGFRGNAGGERLEWGSGRIMQRRLEGGGTPATELATYSGINLDDPARRPDGGAGYGFSDVSFGGIRLLTSSLAVNLDARGLTENTVTVPLGASYVLQRGGGSDSNPAQMQITSTILSDAWVPTGAAGFRNNTDGLVPFDDENVFGLDVLQISESIMLFPGMTSGPFLAPELGDAAAGGFNMVPIDQSMILPEDRVTGGSTP